MSRQRGQAVPLVLALAGLLVIGVIALFTLGRAPLAGARAQTAADLAALSAARELVGNLGAVAAAEGGERDRWRVRIGAVARRAAAPVPARVEAVNLGDGAWPPVAVEVVVSTAGPVGTRARAVARAGLTAPAVAAAGPVVMAAGGGYAGPLVHRDGKPMCPAVAAAYDLMDAAARADGVDLVVVSGFRSDAEQAALFARHPDPRWVAPPGRSRHRDATELDINLGTGGATGAYAWLAQHAGRFGFLQRYSWEPWHWGYLPGCGGAVAASAPGPLPGWVPAHLRAPIVAAATAHGLPPALLAALLRSESGFDPRAVSPAGALGIAQFMPATAAGIGLADPFDPAQAIPAAARLLSGHLRAFGSVPLALAAYNAGPGAVARHGGVPPYRETEAYVARVMALAGGAGAVGSGWGAQVRLLRVEGRLV